MEIILSDPIRFLSGVVGYGLVGFMIWIIILMPITTIMVSFFEEKTRINLWKYFLNTKNISMLILVFSIYFSYGVLKESKENKAMAKAKIEAHKAKEAACDKDPLCQDSRAKKLSENETWIVESKTGKVFLGGELCPNKCIDLIEGYEWAELRGLSKEYGCSEHSGLFKDGCLGYVADRIDELSTNDDGDYEDMMQYEPQPECRRSGRYGDC